MIYAAVLLFFVLEYVRPGNYVPALNALHLNSIVPLGAFAGTVLTRGQTVGRAVIGTINTRIVAGLLLLVALSLVIADVKQYVTTAFMTLLGYAFAYWMLVSELDSVKRIKGVMVVLLLVHLVIAALNPVLFLDPEARHYIMSGSFLGDGNDFALSINIVAPFCLLLLLDSKRVIGKVVWAGALLALAALVIMTKSRGGSIGLILMALCYWWTSDKKVQTAVTVVACLAVLLPFAPQSYFERMNMINTEESSAAARITAWGAAVRMAADNPLFGVGAGHFPVKYGLEYHPADAIPGEMTAHSLYFLALGELGVPGATLVLSFIWLNIRDNRRLANTLRQQPGREGDQRLLFSMTASLVGFATSAAFLSCLYYPHIYILAGLMTATRRVLSEKTVTLAPSPAARPTMQLHWSLRPPQARQALVPRPTR